MGATEPKRLARIKRRRRIRKRIKGTSGQPRLCVFRSAKHIYAQIIDDSRGLTLAAASSAEAEVRQQDPFENKLALATFIGKQVGERAQEKGIKKVEEGEKKSVFISPVVRITRRGRARRDRRAEQIR